MTAFRFFIIELIESRFSYYGFLDVMKIMYFATLTRVGL